MWGLMSTNHPGAITIRGMGMQLAHFTQPPGADALAKYLQRNFPGGRYS